MSTLRRGFATWRRLGPVRGTSVAARLFVERLRPPLRRARLRRRPLRASRGEAARALGGRSAVEALRAPVLEALPTVAAFERELDALDGQDRADLLRRADEIVAHRFDLLGSRPTDLGDPIDWQRDFKSGRAWPLVHVSEMTISYPDASDVKVPWELSRFQHLPLLAAAHRLTGEEGYLEEVGSQLEHWIRSNPVEFGANWACTMDVAIRAANWVATLALCAEAAAGRPWLERAVGSLLLHGRFVRGHLEWGEVRGNHYLSDVVGLLPVAALFCGGREGRRWARWATGELVTEMGHQVRADGCDHEASISYHRLVCELFLCGTQAADALCPGALPDWYRERLQRMLAFVADHTRPDGLAPQVGDADSGRFLPLGDYGRADPRSHLHLFRQAGRTPPRAGGHAAYADGGYWVMRGGDLFVLVRCGDVGLAGRGGHAHNDQLSFELALGAQPLVVDPGAYVYTADPAARNLFRSTGYHSTLRVGGAEQSELRSDYLFALEDRARAEPLEWSPGEDGRALFAGRHHGFAALDPPALHERRISFDGPAGVVEIEDVVESGGAHELEWTFPLAPGASVEAGPSVVASWDSARLEIEAEGMDFAVEDGWYSPEYGVRQQVPFVRARRQGRPGRDSSSFRLLASNA